MISIANRKICLIVSLLIAIHSYGQKGTIKLKKPTPEAPKDTTKRGGFAIPLPEVGYLYQGYNNVEAGIKFSYLLGRMHDNISLIIGGEFFNHNVTYISPFSTVKYFKQFKRGFALHLSGGYSLTTLEGITDQRITPEVGLGFLSIFSLSYGYNIPIGKERIPFISPNRITLRWIGF